jgi:hypothetical protein
MKFLRGHPSVYLRPERILPINHFDGVNSLYKKMHYIHNYRHWLSSHDVVIDCNMHARVAACRKFASSTEN